MRARLDRRPSALRRQLRQSSPEILVNFLDRHRVQQVIGCARLTTSPVRFALGEFGGRRRLARYRLRDSELTFCIHHGTEDLGVLDEVFGLRHYAIPPDVALHLRRLGRPPQVLDLGAHVGLFGVDILQRFPTARLVAFEPDPVNREALECCVRANRREDDWRVIPACASTADGYVAFAGGQSSGSQIVDGSVPGAVTIRALDVFPQMRDADLLKMDMEGGEWEVLEDPRFATIRPAVVVLEYHRYLCPSDHPRQHLKRMLSELGYVTRDIFHDPSGVGMVWAFVAYAGSA